MTRQQAWAKAALTRVQSMQKSDGRSKYKTLCMKAPTLLKQSGVAQTLAFLRSRQDDTGVEYLKHLAEVYSAGRAHEKALDGRGLQQFAHNADSLASYLALSRELIAISIWMRRFAQSELNGTASEGN